MGQFLSRISIMLIGLCYSNIKIDNEIKKKKVKLARLKV